MELATSQEFCAFADNIELYKEYNKKELFESFCREAGNINFRQRTFDSYLKMYAKYKCLNLLERKSAGRQFMKLVPHQID